MTVYAIRPAGEKDWLIIRTLGEREEDLAMSEPGDRWEIERREMTEEEVDALPDHDGW